MSKFLKFIVHFAVICTIVCVLGLALPPFFGVRTVIMDSTDKATNLPLGSVTYAIPVRTEEVTAGSPILVQEDGKTYKYNLVSVNRENNTGTVIDTTTSAQESITVSVKNWVPKIVITIPFVGYLLVATESVEGLIVLGLVILFLIILYVIAELWRKDPDDDEYEDLQGDTRHVKSSRELKAEEKARAKRMKQEDKELLQDAKEKKKKSKKEEKKKKKIRTGGFVDEIDEDDLDDEPEETVRPAGNVQAATSEAHELLKKEIAAATAEEETEAPESYPEISGEPAESTVSEEEFPEEEIEEAVFSLLQRNHLSIHSVKQVSSIDLKKEEPGILAFCQKYQLPFVTYSAEELLQVKGEFSASEFVKSITGVDNVCERSALLASGYGTMIQKKSAGNGVTAALCLEKWSVDFE